MFELLDRDRNEWDRERVLHCFLPFEASQVLQIPVLNVQAEDKLIWADASNGQFSVKYAYHCIRAWGRHEAEGASAATVDSG